MTTELQEILHKHCPQMDIVDIIVDYKSGIEKRLINLTNLIKQHNDTTAKR